MINKMSGGMFLVFTVVFMGCPKSTLEHPQSIPDQLSNMKATLYSVADGMKDMVSIKHSIFQLQNWNKINMDDVKKVEKDVKDLNTRVSRLGKTDRTQRNSDKMNEVNSLMETQKNTAIRISLLETNIEKPLKTISYIKGILETEQESRRQLENNITEVTEKIDRQIKNNTNELQNLIVTRYSKLEKWIELLETTFRSKSAELNAIGAKCDNTREVIFKKTSEMQQKMKILTRRVDGMDEMLRAVESKLLKVENVPDKVSAVERKIVGIEEMIVELKNATDILNRLTGKVGPQSVSGTDNLLKNLAKMLAPLVHRESQVFIENSNQGVKDELIKIRQELNQMKAFLSNGGVGTIKALLTNKNRNSDRIENSWDELKKQFENRNQNKADFKKNGGLNTESNREEFKFTESNTQRTIVFPNKQRIIETTETAESV